MPVMNNNGLDNVRTWLPLYVEQNGRLLTHPRGQLFVFYTVEDVSNLAQLHRSPILISNDQRPPEQLTHLFFGNQKPRVNKFTWPKFQVLVSECCLQLHGSGR